MTAAAAVRVYVSAGSNIAPEQNLQLACRELRKRFTEVEVSPVYRTAAVGFAGDPFLNCVFAFDTQEPARQVVAHLEQVHALAGRVRGQTAWSARTLDLDLLLYGDAVVPDEPVKVPRDDIRRYAFVLRPLADIAPDLVHPETGESMAELWRRFPGRNEPMEPVALSFV